MTTPAIVKHTRARVRDGRKGIVYFICSRSDEVVKIGFTYNLRNRLLDLKTGNHNFLDVEAWFYAERDVEKRIHRFLHHLRLRNEWFANDARVDTLIRVMENYEIYHGLATKEFSPCFNAEMISAVEELYALEYPKYVDDAAVKKTDAERESQRQAFKEELSR